MRYNNYAHPEDVHLDLWSMKPSEHIKRTTLADALENYIKPGVLLVPLVDKTTKEAKEGQYVLEEIDISDEARASLKANIRSRNNGRGAKEIHFKLSVPPPHFAHLMWKVWHMLGSRHVVEFHVHLKTPLKSKDDTLFDKALNHQNAIHLRPDVMLKAMSSEGIENTISPWANQKSECCWVMSKVRSSKDALRNEAVEFNKRIQLDLDAVGAGIPLYEERKRLKAEMKNADEFKTFNEKRAEAFAQIRSTNPGIEPVVRRLSNHFTPASKLILMANSLRTQYEILAPLARTEPEVFKLVRRSIKPSDLPDAVFKKIRQAQNRHATRPEEIDTSNTVGRGLNVDSVIKRWPRFKGHERGKTARPLVRFCSPPERKIGKPQRR
jgi:hypothetical protein